ncbi:hypothetical protein F5883DRAFT_634955 [Diaporthe sp. PMI_573]|nr:hypothetical protein F5883DRAFT_634955 [Diaporthaceae sp. PMI_573]
MASPCLSGIAPGKQCGAESNHQIIGDIDMLANILPLTTLRAVHSAMVTSLCFSLCFSHFTPPKSGTGRIQHLKLASTSVANAVAVQSIPLRKFIDPPRRYAAAGPRDSLAMWSLCEAVDHMELLSWRHLFCLAVGHFAAGNSGSQGSHTADKDGEEEDEEDEDREDEDREDEDREDEDGEEDGGHWRARGAKIKT